MKLKTGISLIFVLLFLFVILILNQVPIPNEKDTVSLKGKVAEIYEGGIKDVVFKLQGQKQTFYVNRGLERGLNLEKLRADLINKEILIKYPNYWTPLDPGNSNRHISKIEFDGQTIFTEL